MDKKFIYEFRDYKSYLRYIEAGRPKKGRGFRADLARMAGCQTAYISQVLNGSANFSLEQAKAVSRTLLHEREESRYFILLVEYARAGSSELRSHFLELMEELIQKQLNLKDRLKVKDALTLESQTAYYSEWAYAAIHMAITIKELNTAAALAEFFQLPLLTVQKVLKFLVSTRLISEPKPNHYEVGTARIYLSKESPLISKHHANWRLQAMNSFDRETERDLHYTSVISVSLEDVLKIKTRFVKEIDAYNAIVRESKEETVYCLALDFFTLKKE